jgi:cyclopropane-fatty-acyl-phospholipid synthase
MANKELLTSLLQHADITVDGKRRWDVHVNDERVYDRVLSGGTLAAGESYMDGWWDAKALDEFFTRIHKAHFERKLRTPKVVLHAAWAVVRNQQGRLKSKRVAQEHYDLSNDLYVAMLGETMQYTCAYFSAGAKTLDQAQKDKLALVAKKLKLKPGMRVLELGGGFGGLAHYLAKEHKVSVVSYNISKEQVEFGRTWCKGFPVEFRLEDYRNAAKIDETFDRVVSVGLLEHVGPKNYRGFFQIVHDRLKDCGIALVHTIGGNKSLYTTDAWIDKYIFPGGVIPSVKQLATAMEGLCVLEDWHNFGPDYDKTLMAWDENFRKHYEELKKKDSKLDERFYRMWRFYLMASAGAFRSRNLNLWQIVITKGDVPKYEPVRLP